MFDPARNTIFLRDTTALNEFQERARPKPAGLEVPANVGSAQPFSQGLFRSKDLDRSADNLALRAPNTKSYGKRPGVSFGLSFPIYLQSTRSAWCDLHAEAGYG